MKTKEKIDIGDTVITRSGSIGKVHNTFEYTTKLNIGEFRIHFGGASEGTCHRKNLIKVSPLLSDILKRVYKETKTNNT